MRSRLACLSLVFVAACSSRAQQSPPPAPPPSDTAPPGDAFTFVSTEHNANPGKVLLEEEKEIEGDYAVKTPERARELAQAAVSDQLDPKKVWKTSPVFPTTWPAKERAVAVYFHPMAANPHSMTHYVLFSAAFRVDVSLVDGSTKVVPIAKPRQLGTVKQTRPSSLETRELELAESSLVRQLLGADLATGENAFWGYLKFLHEHPELARDLERRQSAFVKWVRNKNG